MGVLVFRICEVCLPETLYLPAKTLGINEALWAARVPSLIKEATTDKID